MLRYVLGNHLTVLDFSVSSESAVIFSLIGANDGIGILKAIGDGVIFFDNFHLTSRSFQDKVNDMILSRSIDFNGKTYRFSGKIIMGIDEDKMDGISRKILNTVGNGKLRIPPLRERKEDIPFIVDQYISYFSQKNKRVVPPVSEVTLNLLMNYYWPKNLDELEEVLHRYILKGEADILDFFKDKMVDEDEGFIPNLKETVRNLIESVEKSLIEKALKFADNNKKKASALLGISYKTLVQKMEKFGINNK